MSATPPYPTTAITTGGEEGKPEVSRRGAEAQSSGGVFELAVGVGWGKALILTFFGFPFPADQVGFRMPSSRLKPFLSGNCGP